MFPTVDDVRIESLRPLLPPAILMEELPLGESAAERVAAARAAVSEIVSGKDDRLLVVVGPCSIHDPDAALEYAAKLEPLARAHCKELCVVMRTYFEKPRTTVGWKGLINDPDLNGRFSINRGLRIARKFLIDVVEVGLPTATEFLDPITPQFMADVVSWGAIGARTTESQVHRELASGLSMPVGFKNGTSGAVQTAVDAVRSAASAHHFLSVTKQGLAAIVATRGNPHCHIILRGGENGPNYAEEHVQQATRALKKAELRPSLMIDTSHANSGKDPSRQPLVAAEIARQIELGSHAIFGVMLESFLLEGRQDVKPGKSLLRGQSITDGCLSFDATQPLLERFAKAVITRRRG
ncbi:MAG TPA: 3-deoxy-7-phosphoheptulonate synthase [Polyangiaceae bacterium]|nr:3-deoxy-7-phosphoheptulonate synthase [Polyangiaceae bacterium]